MQNLFAGSIVRPFARPLLVLALLIGWLPGCATSESSVQKSKGYYQEGVASLAAQAHKQCHPMPNVPGDADWRRAMVPVYVRRTLQAAARGGGPVHHV